MQNRECSTQEILNSLQSIDSQSKNQELYESLFTYISKNKVIKQFISSIEADAEKSNKAATLLSAIQALDFQNKIFKDEYIDCYLLYLIKQNHIEFLSGMTLYVYAMTFMPSPDSPSLQAEFVPMLDGETLSADGEEYYQLIFKFMKRLGYQERLSTLSKNEFIHFII